MNWSEQAWTKIEAIYGSILKMPFITELTSGDLQKERFQFYMAQDSLYLEHFGRTLALIGAKAHSISDALAYIRFGESAIVVENALHESYFQDFGIETRGEMQPACHHYIHFLRSTAAFEPMEVALAGTLPCFWIYKEVGDYILTQQKKENNPYQKWIDTYGGEEFASSVRSAINICNQAAENTTPSIRAKMTEAFITASIMEFDFWDAAYNLRKWKNF